MIVNSIGQPVELPLHLHGTAEWQRLRLRLMPQEMAPGCERIELTGQAQRKITDARVKKVCVRALLSGDQLAGNR
jgi:hypothetical protein